MIYLSSSLQDKIRLLLKNFFPSTEELEKSYQALSERYHHKIPFKGFKDKNETLAYVAGRLPATYGCVYNVFSSLSPNFSFKSLLDLGSGPGTATLAALEHFKELNRITLIEQNLSMQALSRYFLEETEAVFLTKNLLTLSSYPSHEAVVLSYVLTEFSKADQLKILEKAWAATEKVLIIIVPGTPSFFHNSLLPARQWLLTHNALMVAPCPGFYNCPLQSTEDWCHFSARVHRTPWHQALKQADLSYEDEKFSYLIVKKNNGGESDKDEPLPVRIIRPPLSRKGHITLDVCAPNTIQRYTFGKRAKPFYKKAQELKWGDTLSPSFLQESGKDKI